MTDSKKELDVSREVSKDQDDVSRLGTAISELEERLSGVLRSEPNPETEETAVEPALVPLAEDIRGIGMGIITQLMRIESMLRRLEL